MFSSSSLIMLNSDVLETNLLNLIVVIIAIGVLIQQYSTSLIYSYQDPLLETVSEYYDLEKAIEELEIQRRTSLTKSLKYKGLIAEVNEEWDDAKSYYETILNFDSNIGEVKDSLMRVNSRIRLINQMISFIAQAENLNDDKLFNQAQQALIQAQSIMNKGPKMTLQISELEQTLKIASTPVEVTLISDLKTDVMLYKTGKFGLFEQKFWIS